MKPTVADAAAAAQRGELIVFPTDTVYGLGARPDLPEATAAIFEAKRRPRSLELPVLVASIDEAQSVARVDDRATYLVEAFWPGALTLILPRAERSTGWELGGNANTVGVRMPANPVALDILERTGPLAVTSANISGREPPNDPEGLLALFGDAVSVYMLDERSPAGVASTVLDLTHGRPVVVREGAVPVSGLAEVVGASIDFSDP